MLNVKKKKLNKINKQLPITTITIKQVTMHKATTYPHDDITSRQQAFDFILYPLPSIFSKFSSKASSDTSVNHLGLHPHRCITAVKYFGVHHHPLQHIPVRLSQQHKNKKVTNSQSHLQSLTILIYYS